MGQKLIRPGILHTTGILNPDLSAFLNHACDIIEDQQKEISGLKADIKSIKETLQPKKRKMSLPKSWDNTMCKGKRLEYWGKWNGFDLGVVIKRVDNSPDIFMLSVESPFFNISREIIRKDVLVEIEKVFNFLNYTPEGDTSCAEKSTEELAPQDQQSVSVS